MLYPIKFHPQYKYRLWGGSKLSTILNKEGTPEKTGESWELSGVQDSLSVVSNGFLEGNTIEEICEIYMGDLLGDLVYHEFGAEFPLLIKLIDANDVLSIQVHPDNELAETRHNAYGKTEMWFVVQADKGSKLFTGFNQNLSKEKFLKHIEDNTLPTVLNEEIVEKGDCYFIPAGRVHATGAGILFAEIQQTSDITYRIFDWNRVDKDGKPRDLHTDLSLEAIDYKKHPDYKSQYDKEVNVSNKVATCPYFTSNFIPLNKIVEKDFAELDSFIIYICLEGKCKIEYDDSKIEELSTGETVLIPASMKSFRLIPDKQAELLEVYIEDQNPE